MTGIRLPATSNYVTIRPVSSSEVNELRGRLRELGYLNHAIERWFALDPWSSRTFWVELILVAGKAAVLIAPFAALPMTAIMLIRNRPLSSAEILVLVVLYTLQWVVIVMAGIVLVALVLKSRPSIVLDTSMGLLTIALIVAACLVAAIGIWWYAFETPPAPYELALGIALLLVFFVIATLVVSAALLSFSIYELRRIPTIHQRSRGVPIAVAAAVMLALLFMPAYAEHDPRATAPVQVITEPTGRRMALVAVDGLTWEIARTGKHLSALPSLTQAGGVRGDSATERWASVGTGTPTSRHGVRAIEGVEIRSGHHVIQAVSRVDLMLRTAAEAIGMARRRPLPPTVRRRDYVWEIAAARGVPSLAVNWWTTAEVSAGGLKTISQETIFAAAHAGSAGAAAEKAVRIDRAAIDALLASLDRQRPRLSAIYFPALDVILNRLSLPQSEKLALSIQVLDEIDVAVAAIRSRGIDVLLIGLPGDERSGTAVIAASFPLRLDHPPTALDIAPTALEAIGFPASSEMPGRSLLGQTMPRIATYGARTSAQQPAKVDEEYYESLRSLGYIR
jgi:hypothetical protein